MNKTALVTGANRGIGLAAAKELLSRDFTVFLGVRTPEKFHEKFDVSFEKKAIIVKLDVSDEKSIQKCFEFVRGKAEKIDVIINNAGILDKDDTSIIELEIEVLLKALKTNAIGPLLVIKNFLPLLSKSTSPRIINVSSGAGSLARMKHWSPAYSISKTMLNAITKQFSAALQQYPIAVNSVCPGSIRTDMGLPSATLSAKEGADTIVWLATEAHLELTGKFLRNREEIDW